jgi:hypothetical protein
MHRYVQIDVLRLPNRVLKQISLACAYLLIFGSYVLLTVCQVVLLLGLDCSNHIRNGSETLLHHVRIVSCAIC